MILIVLSVVIFFLPLRMVLGSAVSVDRYSHILLVWPISLILIYLTRRRVFAQPAYSAWGAGLYVLTLAAFGLASWKKAALDPSSYISLAILLFAVSWVAAFLLCYGSHSFRAALFPLLFLLLMTPMPDWMLERSIAFLQYGSAYLTGRFFAAAGMPFIREGVVISLPSVTIEIAQECSGIRSSVILVIAGMVLGHLFLTRAWAKVVLIVLLVPLAIAKNAVRIFTLTTLGVYVNPSFLSGRLHHQGGIVFFAVAFAFLWFIVWFLQRFEGGSGVTKATSQA